MVLDTQTHTIVCVASEAGRCHDRRLLRRSKVRLRPQTCAVVDAGFQGLQREHSNTALPTKRTRKRPLTRAQKRANRALARTRISVEHVIGALKRFHILAQRYRNRRRRFGLRLTLIAAITNRQRPATKL